MRFIDRADAGTQLATALEEYKDQHPLVYALPRGGVVLGAIIAERLQAPLSLIIPRKIGAPTHPEYAVAAVTEDGTLVANPVEMAGLSEDWLQAEVQRQQQEAARRRQVYLKGQPSPSAEGKTAIIVDDGVATGLTMAAAIKEIAKQNPAELIVAVPVIPHDVAVALKNEADELVALIAPQYFAGAVGAYYDQFDQVEDSEVIKLLREVRSANSRQTTH
jgi:predicted phosphoribosyltransferase